MQAAKRKPRFLPYVDKRREVILRIMDGEASLLPVIYFLIKHIRGDEILKWLIENRMTGYNFKQWITIRWANSLKSMSEYIVMKINHDREIKPMLVTDLKA